MRAFLFAALATSVVAASSYFVHNLVSDLPGADQQGSVLIDRGILLLLTLYARGLDALDTEDRATQFLSEPVARG